jgi:hypothetical protein
MRALLDVNMLLALTDPRMSHTRERGCGERLIWVQGGHTMAGLDAR